ncbi:MAG TPA: guanylate kinase [Wolbachia sp.]|jgi:guanylate kinase|uniref:guanylate kinase n=1 Tax=Wolbachia endosymbiont of Pentalonia nigronervosa TaxID=1301914 RepID=UPI000EE08792|nr:guanylate kinase [Wolbachia endosymbiont of Pentalonia nigronervosa]MBD0391054.1 guanylate kinase [Wolbachia endosymbiont of Pentalonia nigronervosa]HCE59228.1 guanylate kinase [Wolbachia sp.]
MTIKNEGVLLILSSPSGAGKTTISETLLKQSTNLVRSISITTRKSRTNEIDGKDYFFVTEEKFHQLRKAGKMLEYAKVFGNFYGIPKDFIEQNLKNGVSVLLSIDWQGAFHLFKIMREKVVSIFILPPSMQELKSRLDKRNSDSNSTIEYRLTQAQEEMSKCDQYDYVIINNTIDESVEYASCILKAERLKVQRKTNLKEFINNISLYT